MEILKTPQIFVYKVQNIQVKYLHMQGESSNTLLHII